MSNELKFCQDCRWSKPRVPPTRTHWIDYLMPLGLAPSEPQRCTNPKVNAQLGWYLAGGDIGSGGMETSCERSSDDGPCGRSGKLWEPL